METVPPGDGSSGPSLRQKLVGGGAWALVGKGATLGLNFLTIAMVTRLLDLGNAGAYQLSQSLVLVSAMVARLGLDYTVVYLVSSAVAAGSPGRARRAIRTVVVIASCGAVVAWAALSFGGAEWLGRVVFESSLSRIGPAIGLWSAAFAAQIVLSEAFRGFHAIRDAVLYGGVIAGALTVAGLAVLGVCNGHLSLSAAAWVTALATAIAAVAAGIALNFRVRRCGPIAPTDGYGYAEVLRSSLPILVSNTMTFVLSHVDIWVVGAFLPDRDVAIYATSARLVTLIGVSFLIANQVLPPVIGELAAKGDKALMERTMRGTAFAVGLPAMLVVLAFVVAGGPLLRIAFGPAYERGATVLAILCIGQTANILTGSSLFALLMTGKGVAAMWISGVTGALAIAACLIAVRAWGAIGVAAAVSGVIVVQQLALLLTARRLVGVWTHVSAKAAFGELRRTLERLRR
jgi:O-antigen/teichoic acid export membrane protein